jgi:glyoxalase superfamily protein
MTPDLPIVHIVFDCADPDQLSRFWMVALPGYEFPHGPPDGFASWDEWADANSIPAGQRNAGRTLVDKQGHRPDIFFLRVPEPKLTKNRLHLDVKVGRGLPDEQRRERIESTVRQLVAAGASIALRVDDSEGFWLVLQDPEGNEFCVG